MSMEGACKAPGEKGHYNNRRELPWCSGQLSLGTEVMGVFDSFFDERGFCLNRIAGRLPD